MLPPDGLRTGPVLRPLVGSLLMTHVPRLGATTLLVPLVADLVGGQHRRLQLCCPEATRRQRPLLAAGRPPVDATQWLLRLAQQSSKPQRQV